MSDMDVSLRVRLINQLSRPAEQAEKDLKDLKKAAEQLGNIKGGTSLARDMDKLGNSADGAKNKLNAVEKEAASLRNAIGKIDNGSFDNLKSSARSAETAVGKIKAEADHTRQAIGRIDDGALDGLKADATTAKQAIREIGAEADRTQTKLKNLNSANGRGPLGRSGPAGRTGGLMNASAAAYERSGLDAYVPLGLGVGYAIGGAVAGGATVAGASVLAAGNDEQLSDSLRVTGGYSARDQERYDALLGQIGARRGVGTQGAMNVFGALQSGGLSHTDAAAMTDNALVFAKATGADPVEAARTTIALRNNMGISAEQMMAAYNSMGLGGKEGNFEVKDMAQNYPSILARMGAQGSTGVSGVQLATAISQSVMKRSGTSSEASTSIEAMFDDMISPDVVERAKDHGVDVFGIRDKAKAAGKDPVYELLAEMRQKIGGNERDMADVFRNNTAKVGFQAVFDDWKEISDRIQRMNNADGTIANDYIGNTDNFNSALARLGANISNVAKSAGSVALTPSKITMNSASETIEGNELSAYRKVALSIFRTMVGLPELDKQKQVEAYQQYGQTRSQGERAGPSSLQRFLFGAGAEPGFDLKKHIGIDLKPAAQDSMGGYNDALTNEGAKAEGIAQGIADRIKAMLGFTVSPTISPTYVAPRGGMPAGRQAAVATPSSVKVTQNITSPSSRMAGIRAQREQNRAVRMAQGRSLADLGSKLA